MSTPTANDVLVRLALGLPEPGVTHTDALAAVAVRATLHLDSFSASEGLRMQQILQERGAQARDAQETERARDTAAAHRDPVVPKR